MVRGAMYRPPFVSNILGAGMYRAGLNQRAPSSPTVAASAQTTGAGVTPVHGYAQPSGPQQPSGVETVPPHQAQPRMTSAARLNFSQPGSGSGATVSCLLNQGRRPIPPVPDRARNLPGIRDTLPGIRDTLPEYFGGFSSFEELQGGTPNGGPGLAPSAAGPSRGTTTAPVDRGGMDIFGSLNRPTPQSTGVLVPTGGSGSKRPLSPREAFAGDDPSAKLPRLAPRPATLGGRGWREVSGDNQNRGVRSGQSGSHINNQEKCFEFIRTIIGNDGSVKKNHKDATDLSNAMVEKVGNGLTYGAARKCVDDLGFYRDDDKFAARVAKALDNIIKTSPQVNNEDFRNNLNKMLDKEAEESPITKAERDIVSRQIKFRVSCGEVIEKKT